MSPGLIFAIACVCAAIALTIYAFADLRETFDNAFRDFGDGFHDEGE
jgi:hypothetical protein